MSTAEGTMARWVYLLFILSLFTGIGGLVAEERHFRGHRVTISRDVAYVQDISLRGEFRENVVVAPGVTIEIRGRVTGDLTLGPGAVANVFGEIGGDVINHGGTLRIQGNLGGSERHEPAEAYDGPPAAPTAKSSSIVLKVVYKNGFRRNAAMVLQTLGVLTLGVGMLMAQVKRGDGTSWVDSHYTFQIRSCYIAVSAVLVGALASIFVVGLFLVALIPIWWLIRCVRGWWYLHQGVPHPKPRSWLIG